MKTLYTLLVVLLISTTQIFAQGTFSSNITTGDWNVAGSWTLTSGTDVDGIPDADDAVTILDGHTITITDDAACTSLTVGGGTSGVLHIGNVAGEADDLTVSGSITVNEGASMLSAAAGTLIIGGNITNNGIFDLNTGAVNIRVNALFNGTANQTVSGTGTTTEFYLININNSGAENTNDNGNDNNNIVEFATTNTITFQNAGSVTLTDGIFKLSAIPSFSTVLAAGSSYAIPAGTGFWLNKTGALVYGHTASLTLGGLLRITAGTLRVGTAADNSLEYTGSSSKLIIDGGDLNIWGRLCRDADNASTITYSQTVSNSNVIVGMGGSTSTIRAYFEIANAGSSFTQTNGAVILYRSNALAAYDYFNEAGTFSVTGLNTGLQLGSGANNNTPVGQIMRVYSTVPTTGLFIGANNLPIVQLLNPLTVIGSVSISTGCTFNTNNHNISVGRSWTNSGTFNGGTSTVTFDGSVNRTFSGNPTSFYNLVFNTTATTITFNAAQTVTNNLTLTDGIVTIGTGSLTLTDNATVTGASDASFINGPVTKIGNDAFTFPVGKSIGGLYQPISISAPSLITDAFTAEYMRASATALDADVVDPIKNVSGCDYWNLNRILGVSVVDVTLSWNANSPCGASPFVTNPATLTVAHYNGTAWDEAGTAGSYTGNAAAGTVTRNAVSVFSPFSLGNTAIGQNTLPVRFGSVKAYAKSNAVQIEWDTYFEEGLSHYEVERSADGNGFGKIGSVTAKNTTAKSTYGLFDAAPLTGNNLYRIRAVDHDGKVSYSMIVRVNLDKKTGDINVYPNPVRNGNVSFQLPEVAKDQYTIKLVNGIAQQVYNQKLNHNGGTLSYSFQLPAGTAPGVYYLQVETNTHSFRKTIIVQQ